MSFTLNKPKLDNLAGNIWKSAERLRGKFKAYEYQGVILPIIVFRRLECVLIKWREDKAADVRAVGEGSGEDVGGGEAVTLCRPFIEYIDNKYPRVALEKHLI